MFFLVDIFVTAVVRLLFWSLRIIPYRFAVSFVAMIIRGVVALIPRYRKIALKNISIVFPEYDLQERERLFQAHIKELGRLLVDFARGPYLTKKWLTDHVDFTEAYRLSDARPYGTRPSAIVVTGHLGSFELLAIAMGRVHRPVAFVARDFKLPRFNDWWRSQRELCGNISIGRNGAVKGVTETLQSEFDVALLFDQNVKRNHAVFVPFCGEIAATTKTPAVAALRAGAPIVAVGIEYRGNQRYAILAEEVKTADVYADETLSLERKVELLSERANEVFGRMIKRFPAGWFWMHRRWKTRPNPDDPLMY
jgi:KDO2-lipid IV(A) lauroyltransferase